MYSTLFEVSRYLGEDHSILDLWPAGPQSPAKGRAIAAEATCGQGPLRPPSIRIRRREDEDGGFVLYGDGIIYRVKAFLPGGR